MEKPRKGPKVYGCVWQATVEPHWLEDYENPDEGGIVTLLLPEPGSPGRTQMRQWVATNVTARLDNAPLPFKRCDICVSQIDGNVDVSLYTVKPSVTVMSDTDADLLSMEVPHDDE